MFFINKFIDILNKKKQINLLYFLTFIHYLKMYYKLYKKSKYRDNIKKYFIEFYKLYEKNLNKPKESHKVLYNVGHEVPTKVVP